MQARPIRKSSRHLKYSLERRMKSKASKTRELCSLEVDLKSAVRKQHRPLVSFSTFGWSKLFRKLWNQWGLKIDSLNLMLDSRNDPIGSVIIEIWFVHYRYKVFISIRIQAIIIWTFNLWISTFNLWRFNLIDM